MANSDHPDGKRLLTLFRLDIIPLPVSLQEKYTSDQSNWVSIDKYKLALINSMKSWQKTNINLLERMCDASHSRQKHIRFNKNQ